MGLEEKSPATDDLLQHIASTFLAQNPSLNPAKAIISLLLGLSTQVEKLTTEVHTLAARHAADVTRLNARINNHIPAPAPQARRPPQRQPTHQPRQPLAPPRPSPSLRPPRSKERSFTSMIPSKPSTKMATDNSLPMPKNLNNARTTPAPPPPSPLPRMQAPADPQLPNQHQTSPPPNAVLNLACNATENPLNNFQLAPTNVDYAIHNVPIFALDVPESIFTPHLAEAVALTTGAAVARARYLTKPENRIRKTTTSIVISVPAEDTDKIGDQIRLFGRSRRCNKLWLASPNTLCRKCACLGQATEGCQSSSPTCPLCAGNHLRKDHRCPNQACPREGHLKLIIDCCATWKAKCINCSGNHTTSDRECPARRTRTHTAATAPAPQGTTPALQTPQTTSQRSTCPNPPTLSPHQYPHPNKKGLRKRT
ncbi:uncharacterized protein LAJ45_11469 [Morchella importuna]|uniref:uncharacterized protein n=1 Tax=Morchella importuna TaxID=1174673 RepID=UPI001E8D8548|nr:uncharacterized protein LAJ45_11469 [Morchella importuna]KAH8144529.1 hypothetical protein LAJ45_11469 [Morchella importuna]